MQVLQSMNMAQYSRVHGLQYLKAQSHSRSAQGKSAISKHPLLQPSFSPLNMLMQTKGLLSVSYWQEVETVELTPRSTAELLQHLGSSSVKPPQGCSLYTATRLCGKATA